MISNGCLVKRSGRSTYSGTCLFFALVFAVGACTVRCLADVNSRRTARPLVHAAPGRLPHGSFVIKPIHGVAELNRHLDANSAVAQRYARLTNMTPRMVHLALSRLHEKRLDVVTNLEVYYCHITPRGEVIGFRRRRIPCGTIVFAFADGTPAILQACGNPTRALALVKPEPPLEPAVAPAIYTSIVSPHSDPIPDPESSAPGSTVDDFEEVPAAELYVPKAPALPAARLATYSADNLYEWVRHSPHGSNRSATGLALAGLSGLGAMLTGGGHFAGTSRRLPPSLTTITTVDLGGAFDVTTHLGPGVIDGVAPMAPRNPQQPSATDVPITSPVVVPTVDTPPGDPVATPEFGSVLSLGGLLAAAGAGWWLRRRRTR